MNHISCLTANVLKHVQPYHGENNFHLYEIMTSPLYQISTRLKQCQLTQRTVFWQTCHFTQTHYPDSSLCSYSLVLRYWQRGYTYKFNNLWFDLILTPTFDLPHPRQASSHHTTDAVSKTLKVHVECGSKNTCCVPCFIQ